MKKDYQVKCTKEFGRLNLSVTHNGYQWFSIRIETPEYEIPLIMSELQRHLSEQSTRPDNTCPHRYKRIVEFEVCDDCGEILPSGG